jgi:hypothetical protein
LKTVVTKAAYAALKGRTPSAVSNWIAAGKITAAALIGEGNRACIWVERADAELARTLDPAQQAGQARPVTSSAGIAPSPEPAEAAAAPAAVPSSAGRAAAAGTDDEDLRRRRRADADKAEYDAEAEKREWGRELARLVGETETFVFNTLARELAERFGLDWKKVSMTSRDAYRKFRATIADQAAEEREQIEAVKETAE